MKILFISRATLYKDKGGDTVQILNTAEHLRKLGVEVTIRLCSEKIDYTGFDLIHFFNIIRPADILTHVEKSRKPFVVSTIYVDYSEYEKKVRAGIAGLAFRIFSKNFIEYLKVIARFIANGEKIISPDYLFVGQKRAIEKILSKAAMLLPNSNNEYNRIKTDYKIGAPYKVIPNGIDDSLFSASLRQDKNPELVICAGRIEGRKNQLNLIRALNRSKFQLVIIGSPSANQLEYYSACKREAGLNVSFINNISQEELIGYYRKAKVHVLASWFETTGLSSLEAAAMGCNIVITDKGDTREYFKDYAYYCDPGSPGSILNAVKQAAGDPVNMDLSEMILKHYTWEIAANETLAAYKEILSNR